MEVDSLLLTVKNKDLVFYVIIQPNDLNVFKNIFKDIKIIDVTEYYK